MVKETALQTVKQQKLCDEDNCDGEMISTGIMLLCCPARYPHVCSVCGHKRQYLEKYPRIVQVEVP